LSSFGGASGAHSPAPRFGLTEFLHWRQLGDEWVVFLADDGLLTALDAFNAAVLDAIEQGADTAADVASALSIDLEADLSDALVDKVDGVLHSLAAAGLLRHIAA
jgi:hypothetical protein